MDTLIERLGSISLQAFQYFAHLVGVDNACNYFHIMTALWTEKRVDFITIKGTLFL